MADSPAASDALVASLTPLQRVSARMNQHRAQSGSSASSLPGSPLAGQQTSGAHNFNSNTDDGLPPSNSTSPTNDTSNQPSMSEADTTSSAQRIAFTHLGPSLKRARKLGQQAGTDLDIFLAASPFEREGQQYALALLCQDKLTSLVGHLDYRVPATFNETCKDYAWAFMLSPVITAYRYTKIPSAILDAMRELNLADVPQKRETGRCAQVEKVIRNNITTCRYTIKDKVAGTLKPGTRDAVDIASLTASIVASTKVKPVAALYMRIAFIRWVAQEWPETIGKDENFWLKVDEQLREEVIEFKTPSKIQEASQAIYDADKLQFGPPDLVNHPAIASYLQDDWLIALNDKSGTLPQNQQSKKRAWANADDT